MGLTTLTVLTGEWSVRSEWSALGDTPAKTDKTAGRVTCRQRGFHVLLVAQRSFRSKELTTYTCRMDADDIRLDQQPIIVGRQKIENIL
jgi:hypothetical protein